MTIYKLTIVYTGRQLYIHSADRDGEWGESGGFLLKSTVISTVLNVFSSRFLRLHQTASSLTSCLYADYYSHHPEWGRSVWCHMQNFRSLTEMCSRWCTGRSVVGREHSPEELQCWSYGCWMRIFPASLAAACLSGSCWSTDRQRWRRRAVSVYSEGCPGWWCLKRSWSLQTGSSHKSLVCPDAAGWSAVPCWLHLPQTCLLCRQTAGGPVEAFR